MRLYLTQSVTLFFYSQGKGKPVAVTKKITHSGSIMGEKLVQAVLMLQQTILDVHSLFFKPATLSDPTLNSTLTVPGLVVQKQLEFINDIDRAFSPLLQNYSSKNKGGLGFDCTAFLADDKTCSPPLEIRNIFDQWLVKAVQRVGERARAALEAMGSATEVARLQQRVWLCCTTVTTGALSSDVTTSGLPSSVSGYTQTNWEESCVELLAVKRRRTSTLDSNSAATSLLWSRVFRLPFMLQVERLLRESCMGVLRGAKGLLLQALFQEGVVIDSITLTASLVPSVGRGGSVASSFPSSSSSSGMDLDYSYTSLCAPSPRIFRKAESVRCLLQDELSDLLRDIIVPVSVA